ncbi:MAG: Wzz/FepE/Etk N-terminal domain-containing protein [Patescibacteria group bacterium]|nr:Wzz/FepE/Etk N-terminal domain-containing protein [Patescibacteria group bacterium]MDD5121306.1 Wzz/FepE/Etk N-terminal domain-containing protein [Patescibacteria group bacterium]MDD5221736.1 Wzz/FepE/Etk N-terminal domain-containing protein [Patescibacteria group bacterium]MDD5395775.1 Wzz/FepE/Etk N-terminal domain-containing protein [Patescibacteria group bacterium]
MDNQQNSQKPYYDEELEINLSDYARVVWRRRKIVSAIFITIIILAITISFLLPKTYQASSLIVPAKISGKTVESLNNVIEVLKQEAVLRELCRQLKIPESNFGYLAGTFKVSISGDSLEVKAYDSTPQRTKQKIDVINKFIINRENLIASRFKPNLEAEIGLLQEDLIKNADAIADFDVKIKALAGTTSEAQGYITASYIEARQAAKFRWEELQKQLYNKQRELNYLSQESSIDIPPVLPAYPIKPNKRLNVTVAAVFGFIIAICYAFVAESISKKKTINY